MTDLCQFLKWDSDFFGRRIARVNPTALSENEFRQVFSWCTENAIEFLYLLVDGDNLQTVRLAENYDFQFMDIRLTLEIAAVVPRSENYADIRPHQPQDVARLKAIARVSHHDSRFYADDHIPPEQSDRLYEVWIENSCNGYAQQVLVALDENVPVGYITCHLDQVNGQIGLLGVSAAAQGKGFGSRLIGAALRWFGQNGAQTVSVVTQGRNVPAQRVYQRNGFITRSVQLWYHRWF